MKIGICMLLWTTRVAESRHPVLEDLKATGCAASHEVVYREGCRTIREGWDAA